MLMSFRYKIFQKLVIFTLVFFCCSKLFANGLRDTLKFKMTAEVLLARNYSEIKYIIRNYYFNNIRNRNMFYVTLTEEIDRSNKKSSPWLNPLLSLSGGYLQCGMHISEFYHTPNGYPHANYVHRSLDDRYDLKAIAIIPQFGIQAKPFLRSNRSKNLGLSFRTGWQFIGALHYSSQITTEESYYNILGLYHNTVFYNHRTTFPDLRQRKFSRLYFQWGVSNLLISKKERRCGYRISYSVIPKQHKGFEYSFTYRIK
jgi:hypothetical protein